MERRFAVFLIIAFAVLMLNALIGKLWIGPQQPPPQAKNQVAEPDAKRAKGPDGPIEDEPVKTPADDAPPVRKPDLRPAPADAGPQKFLSIGSLDPSSPYRMLVTFTNRGAAIQRLELSSPRFRDLDDRTGYLGHMELISAKGGEGCLVQVVGAGTPAALCGIRAGDILLAIDSTPVNRMADVEHALFNTRPDDVVTLSIRREGKVLPPRKAALIRRPLEVMRPEIENFRLRRVKPPKGFVDQPSVCLTMQQIGDKIADESDAEFAGTALRSSNWEVVNHSPDEIVFRRVAPDSKLQVVKRFHLAEVDKPEFLDDPDYPAYHLQVGIEITNQADEARELAYRLDGPTGLPIEGWWYAAKIGRGWGSVGLRDLVLQVESQTPAMFGASNIATGDVPAIGNNKSFMYVGIDAHYFSAVFIPEKKKLADVWLKEVRPILLQDKPQTDEDKRLVDYTCRLLSKPALVEPGQSISHTYRLFAGPKRPDLLAKYHQPTAPQYNLGELVYYGWFGWVAKIMLVVLHAFYSVFHNYGIAIILLTVVVRGCMYPLSRKQALNMVKMQELQPEMKRIQEKYKKDMEKRSKAQQELFRKNNYNPMGGCMLMFVQFPVFIGLYRSLMVDLELRQAPLISQSIRWCSNLAAPDMLYDWSAMMPQWFNNGMGIFALGPYLNILPFVTVGLFILQQKMFMPPAADEQAAMQQKIMQYMMVFIGIMFYKVASGLCLYFIASSIWGIAERKLISNAKKVDSSPSPSASAPSPPPPKPNNNGDRPSSGNRKRRKTGR